MLVRCVVGGGGLASPADDETDPREQVIRFEDRLRDAGLEGGAFIDVDDGTKRSTVRHDDVTNRLTADEVSGNYGIYAGTELGEGMLVDFDVDDYEVEGESEGLTAINGLADTFTVETPHTDGVGGGHRFYKVVPGEEYGSARKALDAVTGEDDRKSVNPSWGTVRVWNGYVVGPGSQLDGCDKDWCDECADPDGGWYRIAEDAPVATISADIFAMVLERDEKVNPTPDPEAGGGEPAETPEVPDDALWERMFDAANGDAIEALYRGDTSAYGGDHSDARMALLSHLAFWTGEDAGQMDRMFRESGLYPHPSKDGKWERVGDGEIRKAIANNDDVYSGRGTDPDQALEDLDELLAEYEDDEENSPDGDDLFAIGRLLGDVENETFVEMRDRAAAALSDDDYDCAPEAIDRHRALERNRWSFNTDEPVTVVAEDGKLWPIKGACPKYRGRYILNFEMDVNAILDMDFEDHQLELEIDYRGGVSERTVSMSVFHERREFDAKVLTQPGMLFKSRDRTDREVLDDLNYWLSGKDVPHLQGTRHMGLHGDEFVIPGHSLTADGWTDEPERKYIEGGVEIEQKLSIPTDRHEYDGEQVAEILRTLPKTRDPERFLPALGWFWSAPFRPHVTKITDDFNHLNVKGTTGAGKSSSLRYLWRCFGIESDPLNVKDTRFAIMATMAATNSLPMWYDEYKPGEMSKTHRYRFHEFVRKAATGSMTQKGQQDLGTRGFTLKSPIVISGEEEIHAPAERRRSILTQFKRETVEKGTDTYRTFKELVGDPYEVDGEVVEPEDPPDPTEHALAYYQWLVSHDHETVRERWLEAKRDLTDHLQAMEDDIALGDMEEQGLVVVLFGLKCYRELAAEHGVPDDDLWGEADVRDTIRYIAKAIGPGGRLKRDEDRFVELAARAAAHGYLTEGREYTFIHEGSDSEELRFHLSKTFDSINKFVRDYGLNENLLSKYTEYRERFAEREDDRLIGAIQKRTDHKGDRIGKMTGIITRVAVEELDFETQAFKDESAIEGAVTLADMDRGYETIEVEVVDLETPAPTGDPGASGAIRDETATVNFVCWDDLDDFDVVPERGGYYRFIDANAGEWNGAPQVEINPRVTTIQKMQAGAGHTPGEDSGENETLMTQEERIKCLRGLVNAHEDDTEYGAPLEKILSEAVDAGISESTARHELETMREEKGEVYETTDGHLRLT